jgi:hypothetical protein
MPDLRAASPTVHSLHVLAEHVLGAGLHAVTGHIGLQVAVGGFATPESSTPELGARWSVAHGELVITRPHGSREHAAITTVRAAAEFFGVDPGMPPVVYTPATGLDLDGVLTIDRAVAEQVASWLALGDEALDRFAGAHGEDEPSARTLWPEHFDLGLTMGEVNYGVSPGDAEHAEPYLYVGPWTPREGQFWNESFGASVAASKVASVDAAVAFFEQGCARVAIDRVRG